MKRDGEQSQRHWIQDTRDAREHAREAKRQMSPSIANDCVVNVPDIVAFFHNAVIDYADHIAPKANVVGDLWGEELDSVRVPKSGATHDAGDADLFGDYDVESAIYQIPWTERAVSLETLQEQWSEDNQITYYVKVRQPDDESSTKESYRETLHLPPRASKKCFRQLDKCMDELGWLPDAAVQEYRAGNDEVLTHS